MTVLRNRLRVNTWDWELKREKSLVDGCSVPGGVLMTEAGLY